MIKGSPKKFLFTVDVEDWFQVENFKSSIPFDSWKHQELRVERNVHKLLDLFDEMGNGSRGRGLKGLRLSGQTDQTSATNEPTLPTNQQNKTVVRATFFLLGWIARNLPGLVREIHSRGHEIASHGINHHLCTDETIDALRKDLTDSKALLEDTIGGPVYGYRAPSFSISDTVLKIIEESGYLYDSSYNSFDKHGRYGKLAVNGFPKTGIAYQVSDNFSELPISNLSLKPIAHSQQPVVFPFGGGGYFRLMPYALFKKGIRRLLTKENAYSFYLHPWEVDPGQPRVENAPALMKFRHYVNLKTTANKIKRMLDDFRDCRFVTCREYLEAVGKGRL